jgi:hypothetical protein
MGSINLKNPLFALGRKLERVQEHARFNKLTKPYTQKVKDDLLDEAFRPKSRATVAEMPAEDFLEAAFPFSEGYKPYGKTLDKYGRIEGDIPRLKQHLKGGGKFDTPIGLRYENYFSQSDPNTIKMTGHEGRHRVHALKQLGKKSIAIEYVGKGDSTRNEFIAKHGRTEKSLIGEGQGRYNRVPAPKPIFNISDTKLNLTNVAKGASRVGSKLLGGVGVVAEVLNPPINFETGEVTRHPIYDRIKNIPKKQKRSPYSNKVTLGIK